MKIDKIVQAIGRLKERYPRVARYFQFSHDQDKANRLQNLMPTNTPRPSGSTAAIYLRPVAKICQAIDELWRIYVLLTRAENAFRGLKSPFAERPIFHHLKHRVEAFIFFACWPIRSARLPPGQAALPPPRRHRQVLIAPRLGD